uniref:IBH1-like N-terminal domain-containing protein n=1 Tax=Oryza brachyantha TaxID=4533 RepID=J3LA55_ORYBR
MASIAAVLPLPTYLALPDSPLSIPSGAMRAPGGSGTAMDFKKSFLKNLLSSLQSCSSSKAAAMTLQERKHAVKSSADIAMAAAARGGTAGAGRWPHALLASSSSSSCKMQGKVTRCKSIVRRCCHKRRRGGGSSSGGTSFFARTALGGGSEAARRLVRKRTMVLRRMVPGGELLDETSLLREAMDYVAHLHAQVDVLRRVSRAVQRSNASSVGFAQFKEGTVQISELLRVRRK